MRKPRHLSAWVGIVANYKVVGLESENAYRKTDVLLNLYRQINWCLCEKIEELNQITYESCFGDHETLSYLLNFAPDKELEIFRSMAINAMNTKVLLKLLNQAIKKVKEYPENGKLYYSVLDLTYISQEKYSESEILTKLNLERSTYFRRKKEAIYLLGYILFGQVMPDFIDGKH